MPATEILYFENDHALAEEAARQWLARLQSQDNRPTHQALSGGRSARALFESTLRLLAQKMPSDSSPPPKTLDRNRNAKSAPTSLPSPLVGHLFRGTHFFWADERCVPPEHPESNYGLARQLFLEPLGIVPAQVHRIPGEFSPRQAAAAAEAEFRAVLGPQTPLDLVFLGLGEDGHVASLFPRGPEEMSNPHRIYLETAGPKPPPWRVTLTYPALTAAIEVWVLVCGSDKQAALSASMRGPSTPLGRLLQLRHGLTRLFATKPNPFEPALVVA